MGLDIRAIKPIEFLRDQNEDEEVAYYEDEDSIYIYTLDFPPIKHLTKFRQGWWRAEWHGQHSYSAPYGAFNRFREKISKAIYDKTFEEVTLQIEYGMIAPDAPFAEMLQFADNEGCFDYGITDKLLLDFHNHYIDIARNLTETEKRNLDDYIAVLRDVKECQGVAWYH